MDRPHIVLVSQEVWPLVQGGGIGRHVAETARLLNTQADVTILTPSRHRHEVQRLRDVDDVRLPPVHFEFIEEPGDDIAPYPSWFHAMSARTWDALRALLERRPASLIEWEDYRSPAAVALDAKRTGAPELADTVMAVRLHTSWELTAVTDDEAHDSGHARILMALERLALRFADLIIAPNEATLRAYRAHYGAGALAPNVAVLSPAPVGDAARVEPAPVHDGPLRLLYAGRMQRLKGVTDLARAMRALGDADLRLTMVGGDTATGPAGGSMRRHLGRLLEGDARITLQDRVSRDALDRLIDAHDLVVLPSRVESHGYIAREALARGRPVVATPVGGFPEVVVDGRSGWLARDPSPAALADVLRPLAKDPAVVRRLTTSGTAAAALDRDPTCEAWVAEYLDLHNGPAASSGAQAVPEIAAVISALLPGDLAATVHAVREQDGIGTPEIVVVTDDPLRVEDTVASAIHELVVVDAAASRAAARACAVRRVTPGRAVLLLDAGDTPDRSFATTALHALTSPDGPAYVTARGGGRDPRNAPLGNAVAGLLDDYDIGGSVALFAPDVLPADLPEGRHGDDQALFAELEALGHLGAVLPAPVAGRIRPVRRAESRRAASVVAARPEDDTSADGTVAGAPDDEVVATFSEIYATRRWTDAIEGMPASGRGSLPDRSRSVILYLQAEIDAGRVTSIADVGCGDLTYIQRIPSIVSGAVEYTGFDVVPDLLARHRALPWGRFVLGDVSAPGFRADADLVLVKDVLFHLDDERVLTALEHLAASTWQQLVLTSQPAPEGPRTFDHWHFAPIDFEAPPFSLESVRRLYRLEGGAFLVVTPEQLDAALSRARAARAT